VAITGYVIAGVKDCNAVTSLGQFPCHHSPRKPGANNGE
jgi:hypothetical protein